MDKQTDNREQPTLFLVVPCFNEEEVIRDTTKQLINKLQSLLEKDKISDNSKIVYVNDGSTDTTFNLLIELSEEYKQVAIISLAKNAGHQNALLCGLMYCRKLCDITISLDADLQDDINVIDKMIEDYAAGSEIVYGVRSDRTKDTFLKRLTAEGFYKLQLKMGMNIIFNHADYRLMSSRVLETLSKYKEVNLYLRGIVPELGYKTSQVTYQRQERKLGQSKYTLAKMLKLATTGITSFTTVPLKLAALIFMVEFIAALIFLILGIALKNTIFILCTLIFGNTAILAMLLWILGIYTGNILSEVKHRPLYNIDYVQGLPEETDNNDKSNNK